MIVEVRGMIFIILRWVDGGGGARFRRGEENLGDDLGAEGLEEEEEVWWERRFVVVIRYCFSLDWGEGR